MKMKLKRAKQTIFCVFVAVALCCVFAVCGFAAGKNAVQLSGQETENASANDYRIRAGNVYSYLTENADGTLTRVEAQNDSAVLIETYSADGTVKKSDRTIASELPLFGGFYAGKDAYFLVFGQKNPDESNGVEVLRVVKYSKSWQRQGSASAYGENTYIPFDAGSLRMTEAGGKLFIETCHEMYQSSDGLHHQANMYFCVDESAMQIVDRYSGVMNISYYGYVSHSFNQFICTDGSYVYRADHGDAHPRGFSINRFPVSAVPASNVSYLIPLYFPGDTGINSTGATLGGMALSDSRVLLAGSIDDQTGDYGHFTDSGGDRQFNVFVISSPKSMAENESTFRRITNYTSSDGIRVRTPQLVKVAADRFLLLWEEYNAGNESNVVRAVCLDGSGTAQTQIYTLEARLSDCQPILTSDGYVTWYAGCEGKTVLYKVDPQNPGAFTPAFHNWDTGVIRKYATATENGEAFCTCTVCGKTDTQTVYAASNITLEPDTFVYDGDWHGPDSITVRDSKGNLLKKGVDYAASLYMYDVMGTFSITVKGIGRYDYTFEAPFSIVPAAPTGLKAAAAGENAVNLAWNAVDNADLYYVYQYKNDKQDYVYIGSTAETSFSVKGLPAGTACYFKVRAVGKGYGGTQLSAFSAAASAKTDSDRTPAVPANVKAAPYGDRGVRLTWTASAGATQYNIYRYNGTKKAYVYVGTAYKAAYYEGKLSTGVTYYYRITAVYKANGVTLVSAKSAAANATTVGKPTAPTNVKAAPYGETGIRLTWTASPGATQYNIYRYNSAKKAYVYVGTAYKAAYYNGGLTRGVTYYYKVTAVCKTSVSTFVGGQSAAAGAKAGKPPAVPANVKAAPYGNRGVRLTWTASAGATQYNIYRYNGTKKIYVYVGTAYKAAFYEGGLSTGATYYYRITAVKKADGITLVSAKSAAAKTTTVGKPIAPANVKAAPYGNKGIRLTWTASPGATQYNIYRYNGTKKAYVYVGTAYKPAFYNGGLSTGVTYYYRITAVCKTSVSTFVGGSSAAASAKTVGVPAVPANVKAALYGSRGIRLTWTASPGATQYNIYRYNGTKNAYVYVGTAYKAAYYDGDRYPGTTYYYKIVAVCKTSVSTFVSGYSAAAHATVK